MVLGKEKSYMVLGWMDYTWGMKNLTCWNVGGMQAVDCGTVGQARLPYLFPGLRLHPLRRGGAAGKPPTQ